MIHRVIINAAFFFGLLPFYNSQGATINLL
jgi:hypothetical protein